MGAASERVKLRAELPPRPFVVRGGSASRREGRAVLGWGWGGCSVPAEGRRCCRWAAFVRGNGGVAREKPPSLAGSDGLRSSHGPRAWPSFGLLFVLPVHSVGWSPPAFAGAWPVGPNDLKPSEPASERRFSCASLRRTVAAGRFAGHGRPGDGPPTINNLTRRRAGPIRGAWTVGPRESTFEANGRAAALRCERASPRAVRTIGAKPPQRSI